MKAALGVFTICFIAANTGAGEIHGLVVDVPGGTLPGVDLVVLCPDGTSLWSGKTDQGGGFVLPSIPCAGATIEASLSGFSTTSVAVPAAPFVRIAMSIDPGLDEIVTCECGPLPLSSHRNYSTRHVQVQVVDAAGLPVAGVNVRASGFTAGRLETNQAGLICVDDKPNQTTNLVFRHPLFRSKGVETCCLPESATVELHFK